MSNLPSYTFDYLKLVTQLGLYQTENDNSNELTREILGFFQSSYADDLMVSGDKEKPIEKAEALPEVPSKTIYISSIHGIDQLKYAVQVEIEADSLKEAEEIANSNLKMGEWASVSFK